MRVTVVFVRVPHKPEYDAGERRLAESYLHYDPGYPNEVVVIDQGADDTSELFKGARHIRYDGGGWDCGAWQFAGKHIDTDLLVCFNSSCRIMGDGWLKRFVDAVEAHGEGLYGPLTSYEIAYHVRTPCMIFQPHIINDYPVLIIDRKSTYCFESMGFVTIPNFIPNFTAWTRQRGFKTMMVTWDGVYDQPDWRKPPNIFRRGDQSNLIVRDRHCDAYEASDGQGKLKLEHLADGL